MSIEALVQTAALVAATAAAPVAAQVVLTATVTSPLSVVALAGAVIDQRTFPPGPLTTQSLSAFATDAGIVAAASVDLGVDNSSPAALRFSANHGGNSDRLYGGFAIGPHDVRLDLTTSVATNGVLLLDLLQVGAFTRATQRLTTVDVGGDGVLELDSRVAGPRQRSVALQLPVGTTSVFAHMDTQGDGAAIDLLTVTFVPGARCGVESLGAPCGSFGPELLALPTPTGVVLELQRAASSAFAVEAWGPRLPAPVPLPVPPGCLLQL